MLSQGKNTVNTLMFALMQTPSDAAKENMPSSLFLQASRLARLAFFSKSLGSAESSLSVPPITKLFVAGWGWGGGIGINMSVCPPTCLSVCPD